MPDENSQNDTLRECLALIEERLGWGPGGNWTTPDFKALSEKILAATGTSLSIATLKRLWGTVSYESRPTVTTLNALAQFLGFENWRKFEQGYHGANDLRVGRLEKHTKTAMPLKVILSTMLLIAVGSTGIFFAFFTDRGQSSKAPMASHAAFSFSSKKMVDTGVPNTVIFEYDASAVLPGDSVFIQQSWDPKLRQRVPAHEKVHTSIYYYPGFYKAKLVVNDSIVKEHALYIKSEGWLAVAESAKVPVYFKKEDALQSAGILTLPEKLLKEKNIAMQPETPWVSFFNIREFEGVMSDAFDFETAIRHDYNEGSAVCQHSEVHILLEGGAIIIPLSIPGCVSALALYDMDGKLPDPSPLGVNLSDWVKLRYTVHNKLGSLYINDALAYDSLNLNFPAVRLVGLRYRFQGTGSVDYVRLGATDSATVFTEEF